MSRPFLIFHTAHSGGELLSQLLEAHRNVKILGREMDQPEQDVPLPPSVRFRRISRFWAPYDEGIRQARGVQMRIQLPHSHWPFEGELREMILSHNPEIFVLRDDDRATHAARRFHSLKQAGLDETVVADPKDFETVYKAVRFDDLHLTNGLQAKGPIFEIARSELFDHPQVIMDGAIKRLGLRPYTLDEGDFLPPEQDISAFLGNPEIADAVA